MHLFTTDPREKQESRKVKVSELTGAKLDYWVAKAEGKQGAAIGPMSDRPGTHCAAHGGDGIWQVWTPSTNWAQGGPIIARDRIAIEPGASDTGNWLADMVHPARSDGVQRTFTTGPAPLIAAMRVKKMLYRSYIAIKHPILGRVRYLPCNFNEAKK